MTDSDRRTLLRIAREHMAAHTLGRSLLAPAFEGELAQPAGAFVTLYNNGELRGCIGHIEASQPVARVVAQCAAAACSRDPRFSSVTDTELPLLDIEISVLGVLERVFEVEEIEIGRHGLVAERGWRRGLLLPQVAREHQWSALTFVEQTCVKAGIAKDGWRKGATIWRFVAEVFSEREMGLVQDR